MEQAKPPPSKSYQVIISKQAERPSSVALKSPQDLMKLAIISAIALNLTQY